MKGDPRVINALNQVLRKELTGINQYFIHAKMCKGWGYEVLFKFIWKESIEEMEHADKVIDRILFLEGIPNIVGYDKITVGNTVKEQLENDLGLEMAAIPVLKESIRICLELNDDTSRELLEHICQDEEHHVDWIESQLHLIGEVGYENYLTQQIFNKE
ncbi:MAG: bacterioferritin [Deltaproteobacteria bacterium]|nr:bacterioferritin [Deltaproteobacteria bacterium]